MRPADVQRVPAKTPGGTVAMPTFMASQVVPQTKHNTPNSMRWRAAIEIGTRPVVRYPPSMRPAGVLR